MYGLPDHVRELPDCLDVAGDTTAAMSRGIASDSAALASLAFFEHSGCVPTCKR